LWGWVAGPGGLTVPDDIVAAALAAVAPRDFEGKRILVTAGGTREALDPVRFIGNRSSGKQGVAIAVAAAARGADVTLIAANLEVEAPAHVSVEHVSSTLELETAATRAAADADVVIMAAAVADYRPETVAETKIKKETQGDELQLTLVRNPDILKGLAASRPTGQVVIGFAAETEPERDALLELGRAKAARKGVDYLVINRVGWSEGFATERNEVVIMTGAGDIVSEASGTKAAVANSLLDLLT
jgi:phosphopantothenoylcysteine decarboxylase / phosphopantothenate---cysteine ligase